MWRKIGSPPINQIAAQVSKPGPARPMRPTCLHWPEFRSWNPGLLKNSQKTRGACLSALERLLYAGCVYKMMDGLAGEESSANQLPWARMI
ncbi:MAG: hypothetical protein ABR907_04820 [Terracidiphilus sp.]